MEVKAADDDGNDATDNAAQSPYEHSDLRGAPVTPRLEAFGGPDLFVICRDISGADCNRPMRADAENCGIPEHRRVHGRAVGPAQSLSTPHRRHTSIYEDDVEWAETGDGKPRNLETLEPDTVRVSGKVQRAFTRFHRCDADEAIDGIRLVIRRALKRPDRIVSNEDFHLFHWRGFQVHVTSDLGLAYAYHTQHQERTPQMVDAGTPSRFKGSKKRVQREERAARLRSVIETNMLSVGDVVESQVCNVVDFGIFVDIWGFDALVHRSELSHSHDPNPHKLYRVGDPVTVQIKDLDIDRGRVAASIKAMIDDPWQWVAHLKIGQKISGEVVKVVAFGVFIDVGGIDGLVHTSELPPTGAPAVGTTCTVTVTEIDEQRRRISFSLR